MTEEKQDLTYRKIFVFWAPLAATWLMMAAEGPFLAAVIARLGEAKFNLAAFGVAISIALIVESPIIMLLSAATALVKDRDAYLKLRHFTRVLNVLITLVMILILIPPVFAFLMEDLIGLPQKVSRLTHISCLILIPWPVAIGFRRFYQGVLIRDNLTRRVAYGTVVRLLAMTATALLCYSMKVTGAYTGAAALSVGVICETAATRMMADGSIKKFLRMALPLENTGGSTGSREPLSFRFITRFYFPLALTSMLSLGVHPFVTFFMGKGRNAIESLAVLPVVNALVFIFRSLGLSYQEVAIALMGEKGERYRLLRNFALILGVAVTGGLCLVAFTPLATTWFRHISGLSPELSRFSYLPTQILVLLPGLTVWISFQRALLVNARSTGPITTATAAEFLAILSALFIFIFHFHLIGAVAAAAAYTLGRLCANLYLLPPQVNALRVIRGQENK